MPLQNRVTPFGAIVAVPGRGLFTGNRGILHDDRRHVVRPWQTRRWITCLLHYKGIRRPLMQPHRWTQLFFLDEAAALAAGHRPCAECRRDAYRRFQTLWRARHGEPCDADAMDWELHRSRLSGRAKRTYRAELAHQPDGAYVVLDASAWLVWGPELFEWSDAGYRQRRARPAAMEVDVLTPRPVTAILEAGYRPEVHPSAAREP
ncbi:MAG: hypothetical protein JO029_13905 [Candidatus Eremiobacteraeota bacterium]|nr:hypothetical protein [Candidatus Eremiobacteraeota bacterium]MBV8435368.1 hypothetical protein [Candidatus Eremiobacteraeota bacterium]MBV8584274.1 hypothetical protein [Candidatus Eremiobacteraeota bacterium]MBV8654437.1 hypothetical protein [Candidatus Eremiobacteraeota bacterium]